MHDRSLSQLKRSSLWNMCTLSGTLWPRSPEVCQTSCMSENMWRECQGLLRSNADWMRDITACGNAHHRMHVWVDIIKTPLNGAWLRLRHNKPIFLHLLNLFIKSSAGTMSLGMVLYAAWVHLLAHHHLLWLMHCHSVSMIDALSLGLVDARLDSGGAHASSSVVLKTLSSSLLKAMPFNAIAVQDS
eukprot:2425426-Amphidinium_carterae.4